jgi:Putative auto-transporter adhesin, head GIN domain
MRKGIILSAFIMVMVLPICFASGKAVEKETRNIDDFTKVSFGIPGNLYINFGPEFKVVLEGDKDLIDDILTTVSGDRLMIKKDNWRLSMNERVSVYLTMPRIEGLSVSGSGKAEIMDAVKADNLNLSVSGSGKLFTKDIRADELSCRISGSGDIIISGSGEAGDADIAISGSGSYKGESCMLRSADIHISGSGSCSCNVTDNLDARVSGSGNINYLGNPKVDARVSGSGRVRSR